MNKLALASMGIYILFTLILVFVLRNAYRKRERVHLRSVVILVLGDIGRSPRMMYHAESFAKVGFETYLVGYAGSTPIPSLRRLNVELVYFSELPAASHKLPFVVLAPFKIAFQAATILWTLLHVIPRPPEFLMVQNPPSIPTLALVSFVCKLHGSKLIIDWHNLGYSILALKLGSEHIFVKIAKKFESYFGRHAYIHLFVTQAMREYLVKEWNLQGTKAVLYDRPPSHFRRSEVFDIHDLFNKLAPALSSPSLLSFFPKFNTPYSTPLTHLENKSEDSSLRLDRPALIVSSTSWTPDEDFAVLLEALEEYEKCARHINESKPPGVTAGEGRLPKLLAIVTGKGPLKSHYMNGVARLEREQGWRWVRCCSLWLEAEDYPILLGSADLGVCLHSSSSALDLPMKIVDMFGCGLPVCALSFGCLPELVKGGKNGHIFRSAGELATQIVELMRGFPRSPALAALNDTFGRSMTRHAVAHSLYLHHEADSEWAWSTWSENWDRVLKPLVLTDVDRDHANFYVH